MSFLFLTKLYDLRKIGGGEKTWSFVLKLDHVGSITSLVHWEQTICAYQRDTKPDTDLCCNKILHHPRLPHPYRHSSFNAPAHVCCSCTGYWETELNTQAFNSVWHYKNRTQCINSVLNIAKRAIILQFLHLLLSQMWYRFAKTFNMSDVNIPSEPAKMIMRHLSSRQWLEGAIPMTHIFLLFILSFFHLLVCVLTV